VLGIGTTGPLAAEATGDPGSNDGGRGPARVSTLTNGVERDAERDAWAVLASADGLGPVGFGHLLRRYGTGQALLQEASREGGVNRLAAAILDEATDEHPWKPRDGAHAIAVAIAEAAASGDRVLAHVRRLGLRVVTIQDTDYPSRLAAIEMPPWLLFVQGNPAAMGARSAVAVVGTRRATDRGRATAAHIARDLVTVGTSVVSGLAVGIDGAAHAAAVRAGGTTVAVIGSGHGVLHPRAHARLAQAIVESGGVVVAELAPHVPPGRGTFPRRNRLISGLADATVVVEAPARSGALITASWALEQGRPCFLVPGAIDDTATAGCLAFLREFPETRIVAGIPQLIDDLGLADHLVERKVSSEVAATLADVGPAAARLGRELVNGRATVDELVAATGWPVASVLVGLTLLERRGLAVGIHGRFRPAGTLVLADPRKRRQRPRRKASTSAGRGDRP
jgi:DNA processing protein